MDKHDFLLEIGCEELPPNHQIPLVSSLAEQLKTVFRTAELPFSDIKTYVTPRRIAVLVGNLGATQPPQENLRLGPSYQSAYDKQGTPTLACRGFARSCGVSTDQLEIKDTPKGKRVCCYVYLPQQSTVTLLPELVNSAIKKLSFPKPMRWGNNAFTFIRPVHWALTLYGKNLIPATILGKKTGRKTRGHRFHYDKELNILEPRDYNNVLYSKGYVIADHEARRKLIERAAKKAAGPTNHPIIDPLLLEEVNALVEWPQAFLAKFNSRFLSLPREVLIMSMMTHLKCFPVEDPNGKLLSQFIVISNIETPNPKKIVSGNEKVINARLSDAEFFYKNDQKNSLESRLPLLNHVIFENQLGSLEEKSHRLSTLAAYIAKKIGATLSDATRAGLLSKSDLVSEMVTEFPKLQGIMGGYYAAHDGESTLCSLAIKEQYLPRFSGDTLPEILEGCALSLAERVDTLVGILGINKHPTGDKDPYGLRRASLGMIRILIEKKLSLDLVELIKKTQTAYPKKLPNTNVSQQTIDFIFGRLKVWYQEQGVAPEVFESVLTCHPTTLLDFHYRVNAVQEFQRLPAANALSSANKRVSNILKKITDPIPKKLNFDLFEYQEERDLANQIEKQQKTIDLLYKKADYTEALTNLSSLKEPIDVFFDKVMVMDKNKKKRLNRLALLVSLRHLFTQIADISLLQ